MNPQIDQYLAQGCGRCPLGGTPDCKVHLWPHELVLLREIVLECGLNEELKWGAPCYTFQEKNVAMIAAFKDHCVLSFFKGVLLNDPDHLLEKPGQNTQSARIIKFTSADQINSKINNLKAYIFEAIEVEKAGLKPKFPQKDTLEYPEELQEMLSKDTAFLNAFEALTPGRKRGYILHFSQPKQAATKISRIEKCIPKIFAGKGLNDR